MSGRSVLAGLANVVEERLPQLLDLRFKTRWKPDGSPVTEADILLEAEIRGYLEGMLPGIAVIGEETFTPETRAPASGWLAVVDPVDGTENFCSGLKEWGVSVTLWKDGGHAASLLMLPELGERLMTGDAIPLLASRIVGLSSTLTPETAEALSQLDEARIIGCSVYNLFNVVRGSFCRFFNPRGAHSWDLLAGAMLALEHRCDVIIDGVPYDGRFLEAGRRHRVDIRHRYDLHPR
ncbi:inositol monophosphatase family protein [Ensifer soli]|uniref:inositol monophosphatase family protein n=1 Tax=Ciceribacter sp. sgz301302 TaxID=3342379 RepID=UPI0035BB8BE8